MHIYMHALMNTYIHAHAHGHVYDFEKLNNSNLVIISNCLE